MNALVGLFKCESSLNDVFSTAFIRESKLFKSALNYNQMALFGMCISIWKFRMLSERKTRDFI